MPSISRLGDKDTGHSNSVAPVAINSGTSPNVFCNGIPVAVVGSGYQSHNLPPVHSERVASGGSPTVFVNGSPVHRVGDSISCGDSSGEGSPNVFAG